MARLNQDQKRQIYSAIISGQIRKIDILVSALPLSLQSKIPKGESFAEDLTRCIDYLCQHEVSDESACLEDDALFVFLKQASHLLTPQIHGEKIEQIIAILKASPTNPEKVLESNDSNGSKIKAGNGSATPSGDTPPDDPEDPLPDLLKHLLQNSSDLSLMIGRSIDLYAEEINADRITKHLLRDSGCDDLFPLKSYRKILQGVNSADYYKLLSMVAELNTIKNILFIFSCPQDDRKKISLSMNHALQRNDVLRKTIRLDTSDSRIADKLLAATRVCLLNNSVDKLRIQRLLNPDIRDEDDRKFIQERLQIVPDPGPPFDQPNIADWYAERCMSHLQWPTGNPGQPAVFFEKQLKEEIADDRIVALIISSEQEKGIAALEMVCSSLLLVVLPKNDAERYSHVFMELGRIDKSIEKIKKAMQ